MRFTRAKAPESDTFAAVRMLVHLRSPRVGTHRCHKATLVVRKPACARHKEVIWEILAQAMQVSTARQPTEMCTYLKSLSPGQLSAAKIAVARRNKETKRMSARAMVECCTSSAGGRNDCSVAYRGYSGVDRQRSRLIWNVPIWAAVLRPQVCTVAAEHRLHSTRVTGRPFPRSSG